MILCGDMSTPEIKRHLMVHRQILEHLVRDFGAAGSESQLYHETVERVTFLEGILADRSRLGYYDEVQASPGE